MSKMPNPAAFAAAIDVHLETQNQLTDTDVQVLADEYEVQVEHLVLISAPFEGASIEALE